MQKTFYMEAMAASNTAKVRSENQYDIAKSMVKEGFALVAIDAMDVPEELLGELVEVVGCFQIGGETYLELSSEEELPLSAFVH